LRHFFHLFTPYLEEKRGVVYYERLVASSVLIVGERKMGQRLKENLHACGMEKISFEEMPPDCKNKQDICLWLQKIVDKPNLVVVCGGERSFGFFLTANEVLWQEGIPVLYVQEDWTGGIVGPLVLPGETGCFQCYLERKQVNKEYDSGYELMKQKIGLSFSSTGFLPFHAWLGSLAVTEVVKFLSRYLYPETLKGVFLVDAVNYRVSFHPVLKSPYCPVCGYVDRIPPQRVWLEDANGV
ncbi:MAG: TOMM precursor leader peptide-binding protein, partial [Brevinematales bacterium]